MFLILILNELIDKCHPESQQKVEQFYWTKLVACFKTEQNQLLGHWFALRNNYVIINSWVKVRVFASSEKCCFCKTFDFTKCTMHLFVKISHKIYLSFFSRSFVCEESASDFCGEIFFRSKKQKNWIYGKQTRCQCFKRLSNNSYILVANANTASICVIFTCVTITIIEMVGASLHLIFSDLSRQKSPFFVIDSIQWPNRDFFFSYSLSLLFIAAINNNNACQNLTSKAADIILSNSIGLMYDVSVNVNWR